MKIKTPKSKARLLNIYKVLAVLFAAIVIAVPGSVTEAPEIETELLITVLGVDKTERGYAVSATAVMPQESQSGATDRLDIDEEGGSVSEALEKLSLKMGKKLELGLCGLIVLGRSFTETDVLPTLKYMLSGGRFVAGAYLVLSPEADAKDLIEKSNKLPEASSNGLSKLIDYNATATDMPAITLLEFLSGTGSVTRASYIPCIEIGEKESGSGDGGNGSGNSQGGSPGGGGEEKGGGETEQPATEIKSVDTIALFKDGRFVRRLDGTETRGFTWSDRRSQKGLVTIDDFTVGGENVGKIFCRLMRKKFGITTRLEGDTPIVTLSVEAKLEFEDRYKLSDMYRYHGVSEDELASAAKAQFAEKIKSDITAAVTAMKESSCDAMGLAEEMHKKHLKAYRTFPSPDALFAQSSVIVSVTVKLR